MRNAEIHDARLALLDRLEVTVGNLVAAGPGAPVLTTLVSVSPIYAAFDVDEQYQEDADFDSNPATTGRPPHPHHLTAIKRSTTAPAKGPPAS